MFRNLTYGCDESAIITRPVRLPRAEQAAHYYRAGHLEPSESPTPKHADCTSAEVNPQISHQARHQTNERVHGSASQHLARNPHVPVENDAAAGAPPDWNVSRWTDGALEPWDVPPQQRFGCDQRGMSQLKTFQLSLPGVYSLTPGQGSRQHMLESIARNNQEIEELVLDASLRLPAASSSWRPPPPNSTRHDTGKSMKITLHSISIPREGEPGRSMRA
ncbi:hypothetical protein CGCA056_v015162 [Colletotrichum aenigma]|uniref:uncharacterized protein n=1 Tax=Colletotrichum aenigma TaxID=1215731 RepID=UPI001872C688|nr:uncharacterized protein CGCA056_v015162 [Colletotrichum aenigma]KAF5483085.1 hypothetical protein CGCA056_v015162 [Colletotrichum aenigma]